MGQIVEFKPKDAFTREAPATKFYRPFLANAFALAAVVAVERYGCPHDEAERLLREVVVGLHDEKTFDDIFDDMP